MTYQLSPFADLGLDDALLELLLDEHRRVRLARLNRLWNYYRNALAEPTTHGGSRSAPAQMVGLPPRLVARRRVQHDDRTNREIVIENDIAWRIHTLVDFMFPEPIRIVSRAANPQMRQFIEAVLHAAFDASGGVMLWQNAALLGAVYGYVDFLLHVDGLSRAHPLPAGSNDAATSDPTADRPGVVPSEPSALHRARAIGSSVTIETVEAPRAVPLLASDDYRRLDAFIVHFDQPTNDVDGDGMLARIRRALLPTIDRPGSTTARRRRRTVTHIYGAQHTQRYEDGRLVEESPNRLGVLPVVHVQNLSQPLHFEGLSDVEPLIPLQDELNTRLSDRANRVTMQSFRMWLGKGIENFTDRPIGPGQMWMTDNLDASIESFGGDAASPSERDHIEQLREAIDKASGVTPAAAGHIRARVGNLTSENALRISLMGTVAKTNRKRVTYGAGIADLCRMILHALDVYGVLRTAPQDREVDIVWADALPVDQSRRIADALSKAELGVPRDVLRAELGYPDNK